MLDNTELIETLDETKSKATEVTEKLKQAAKTSIDIDRLRDGWGSRVAAACAYVCTLYFGYVIMLML